MLDKRNRRLLKRSLIFILVSLFCALFGAIYELFSHMVYSYYMIYAFAIPLVFGAIPPIIVIMTTIKNPTRMTWNLYSGSIACFTMGSIFKGVLDIYGTTNVLSIIYPIAGLILLLAAVVTYLIRLKKQK